MIQLNVGNRMIEKRGKELYQPPYAKDLSGFSVNGQVKPMGNCIDGSTPTTNYCSGGFVPTQDRDSCSPTGSLPGLGGCTGGFLVVNGCNSGYTYT